MQPKTFWPTKNATEKKIFEEKMSEKNERSKIYTVESLRKFTKKSQIVTIYSLTICDFMGTFRKLSTKNTTKLDFF
mgnify:CR=1 FL=1